MTPGQALAAAFTDGRAQVVLVLVSVGGLVGVIALWRYIRAAVVRGTEAGLGRDSAVTRGLVGRYGSKDQ